MRTMMVFTLAVCCTAAATGLRAERPKSAYFITVKAVDTDYSEVPVSVTVAAPPGATYAELTEVGAAERVADAMVRDGKAEVTWIIRDLPKGAWKRYILKFCECQDTGRSVEVDVVQGEGGVVVSTRGYLVTRYDYASGPKPFCYPVIGPTGKPVTRSYPMEEVAGESRDHRHQRSFWFTFGDVNGHDFWTESDNAGRIVHRGFEALEGGPAMGRIRARNDWIASTGEKICEDVRELRVYNVRRGRLMDFEITIRATEGPVKFGDTKEGMMGLRVASSMEVKRGQGRIENSQGQTNNDAWGKQAEWCDYSGPVDGKTVGIAVFDHPDNFRHPTYWHVRDYGLFAANPFGLHDFLGKPEPIGAHTIAKGDALTFKYRIYIHEGDAKQGDVAGVYREYAHPPVVRVY